jgi:glyoxylate reductase
VSSGEAKKWKVFCSRNMPEVALELTREVADLDVWEGEDAPPHHVLLERLRDCDGLISLLTDRVDADLMDRCPRLKLITQLAVGFNNIDIPAATSRGIYVTNTPDVLNETVVETTFALLFAISRRIVEADKYVRDGQWRISWHPLMMLGTDLYGAKLAIVGLGRIGKRVALIAQAFGAEVIYFDEYRSLDFEKEHNVQWLPLEQLFRVADFISLHVNLTDSTRHMIDARSLALMKPTAIIINTARGPVINQKDLAAALQERRIGGAALDVFEQEPIDPSDDLLSLSNVVVAPHLGSASFRTRFLMAQIVGRNQQAFWRGERPPQLVNPDVLHVNPSAE